MLFLPDWAGELERFIFNTVIHKFTLGNTGRPKGARNKKTLAIESLLEGQAEALTQTAISKALEGDGLALRLCMECIAPAPKNQPVSFLSLIWKMEWMPLKKLDKIYSADGTVVGEYWSSTLKLWGRMWG